MKFYRYDANTSAYLGAVEAEEPPDHATLLEPPTAPEGHWPRFTGEGWEVAQDCRGTWYWLPGDSHDTPARVWRQLGPLPVDASTEPPPAPPALVAELAASTLASIQAEKCRARDGGFVVDGLWFDSDLAARTAYAELAIAMQQDPTFSVSWRASQGQWVTMDAALFQQVYAAGRAHIESCFAWQQAREQEIAAALALAVTDEAAAREALAAVVPAYSAPEAA